MIVSFTPIRSRSKGVQHKNIHLLNGKPLFHYVVLEALKVSSLNEVWVSTDSEHYASLAPPGVKVHKRSEVSATDQSTTADVLMEFVKTRSDIARVVVLQATSPTTTYQDIEKALQHSASNKGCVSVQPAHVYLYQGNVPLWTTRVPRQDSKIFAEDGSIYVIHVADFIKTKSIPTFPCRTMVVPHAVCDIDTEQDFARASALLYRSSTTVIDIGGTYVRLKYKNRVEQWCTRTLCGSKDQLKEFILDQIKQIDDYEIFISAAGIITEKQGYYVVSDASELMPFWKGTIFPKYVDGKLIKMQNDGDCAVMELVRKNKLQQKNIMLLVFGTGIATGLYINGNVVKNAEIGRLFEPEFSVNFETSDTLKLVRKLTKIKSMLSLDDLYVSGFILKHKHHIDILEQYGIKPIDSYLNMCGALHINAKEQFQQKKTKIIAEIGYNHQGDVNIAKELIRRCKDTGVDLVKLQKQDLGPDGRFTQEVLHSPYVTKNSFGETYGNHRKALELCERDFKALQSYAKAIGIEFIASGHDKPSFDFLETLDIPFYKIGSGDIGNLELIEYVAKKRKPVILSTGMSDLWTVEKSVRAVLKHNHDLTLLHCTSSYPVPDNEVQLNVIRTYQMMFPNIKIGFSGHDQGTPLTLAAVALGCEVVEKHVTLDKQMKGSDHIASLDMNELAMLVRDVRRIDSAMGTGIKCIQPSENVCINKLGKRLVYTSSFEKGSVITPKNVVAKINSKTADDVPIIDTEWDFRKLQFAVVKNENMKINHFKTVSEKSDSSGEIKTGNSTRDLVFLTCTRADFSKMSPLIHEALKADIPVTIWVSGMHLEEEFGSTYMEIVKIFSSTHAKIVFRPNKSKSMSQRFINTANEFKRWLHPSVEMVFVHGDRIESLACTAVAVLENIKVCHIEGGELSGTIDESLRHAITKLAHIHLVSNECSRLRLLQLGEDEARIRVVGSPEVDAWLDNNVSFSDVKKRYDIVFEEHDFMVLLYHPVTISFDPHEIKHVVQCCIASESNFVVIKCNNDTNYETILKEYTKFKHNPHFKYLPSLRFEHFVSLIKHSNGLIGNSSVGVRETPVLGIPSLNIGNRQRNRSTEARSIIHIPDHREMSAATLKLMKNIPRVEPVTEFGSSGCATRLGEFIRECDLREINTQKYFVDI
ncbi:uncharacterized protein LOC123551991 [Mercenaria mercenaria]|uniref:uncharacterized protein LOC123551991 n=1 Tax=Mercenaria mercenaria TaxID=6596 RepID=UPI00234EC8C4|nr:uncharacterized protein LOC123551991 [Mercenaria mercenaria]